ncbi:GerAB/ArcD/ProY family transporter [Aquibacillus albus]|uniref:Spore germination protein KB n=1 Tax=Aquibacillus albus TaxID=1168171 RepID=A0ABS2MX70_9BACI|nr:GerAB/ArcD/ProY family transporter [Aquibacillus albus]MBM7570460.1 spore germination protein KB [Aquibacillus albus]
MIRISSIQLFSLILAFEVGSTTLFALGIGAGQDAWIVVLFAFLVGLILLIVYTQFPKYYPYQNFAGILEGAMGKKIAKPLLFLFALYFYSQATHNFYEFGVLIKMTALPRTPLIVILYMFIFVIIYILCLGFEVLARTAEIFVPYLILFLVATYIIMFFSGNFDLGHLLPILGDGIKPVLGEVHTVIGFPFGEMVVFLMFWHYVREQQAVRKIAVLSVSVSTLLLITSLIVIISVLGPELAAYTEIPLLETLISVNIANVITNLDSISVFIIFIGGFFKTALHFSGFCLAFSWLFNHKNKNQRWVITIFAILLPLFSVYRFDGLDDQRWKGLEGGVLSILLFSFLPVLLLLLIMLKRKTSSKGV